MRRISLSDLTSNPTLLSVGFLLILSYFTYVHGYWYPSELFWDENYHIASAQKYLNGVFFMEPHPPLGKLMIAAGEWLINANPIDNQFIGTDYATNIPNGFSFLPLKDFWKASQLENSIGVPLGLKGKPVITWMGSY